MADEIIALKDRLTAGMVGRTACEAVPLPSWDDVDGDLRWADLHLCRAGVLFDSGRCAIGDERDVDMSRMALMHALQCGYNAFEAAMLRVMLRLGEEPPSGDDWTFLLVRQLSRPGRGRPALFTDESLLRAAYGLHGYRIVAWRTCGDFDHAEAGHAVRDGNILRTGIGPALTRFRDAMEGP